MEEKTAIKIVCVALAIAVIFPIFSTSVAVAESQPYSGSEGIVVDYSSIKTDSLDSYKDHYPFTGFHYFLVKFHFELQIPEDNSGAEPANVFLYGTEWSLWEETAKVWHMVPGSNQWVDYPTQPKAYFDGMGGTVEALFEIENGSTPTDLGYQSQALWSLSGGGIASSLLPILILVAVGAAVAVVAVLMVNKRAKKAAFIRQNQAPLTRFPQQSRWLCPHCGAPWTQLQNNPDHETTPCVHCGKSSHHTERPYMICQGCGGWMPNNFGPNHQKCPKCSPDYVRDPNTEEFLFKP